MCGIVGAVAERNITPILVEGLKRLEYRGYDSAGVAVFTQAGELQRSRRVGKVAELEQALAGEPLIGHLGIAHTRWATHGAPSERNAHPHFSGKESGEQLAVVHNGIIENHEELRERLKGLGYVFTSDTDTETIVHLLHHKLQQLGDLTAALKAAIPELHGAYGLAVISAAQPDRILAARSGSPLVIGLGLGENFLASDQLALRQVTDRFMYLEEGDIAEIRRDSVQIWDVAGQPVQRESVQYHEGAEAADKGEYRHFMLKEIHEQPKVVQRTLEGRLGGDHVLVQAFGPQARPAGRGTVRQGAQRADRRLRYQLPRRHGRPLLAGGADRHSLPDRSGQRVPLPPGGRAAGQPVHHHLPVRRDRRHPGGPAQREAGRVPG
jgi:glutamine---fructose-6-phosphate transaminase (isomerizing)